MSRVDHELSDDETAVRALENARVFVARLDGVSRSRKCTGTLDGVPEAPCPWWSQCDVKRELRTRRRMVSHGEGGGQRGAWMPGLYGQHGERGR
jgi:hypothetical protein